jgi:hypothetical protein
MTRSAFSGLLTTILDEIDYLFTVGTGGAVRQDPFNGDRLEIRGGTRKRERLPGSPVEAELITVSASYFDLKK